MGRETQHNQVDRRGHRATNKGVRPGRLLVNDVRHWVNVVRWHPQSCGVTERTCADVKDGSVFRTGVCESVAEPAYRDPHIQNCCLNGSPCAAQSEGQLNLVRRNSVSLVITCLMIPDGPGMIFEPIADESYLLSCYD